MQVEAIPGIDEKAPSPAEQIRSAALEVQIACRVIGGGLGNADLLPICAAVTASAIAQTLSGVSERLATLAAALERRAPKPLVVKPPTPARANKRPAAARAAAPSGKPAGNGKPAPAAPPGPAQPLP